MVIDDVKGEWDGRFGGTNQGRIRIRLTPVPAGLVAEARLDDAAHGPAYLLGTGEVAGEGVRITLAGSGADSAVDFGTITVTARLLAPGRLTGEWSTSVGTSGTFEASPAAPPVPVPETQPAFLRAGIVQKQIRVPACVLNLDLLRRLQGIVRTAAEEAAEIHQRKHYSPIQGGPPEVRRLYRMSILVTGAQGEVSVTDDPADIDSGTLPQPLASLEFEVGRNYRITTGHNPSNRLLLRLDFTKPSAFDFGNPSDSPTPNQSTIEVSGADSLWVAGVFERLHTVLNQGRVRSGWLHLSHTYDVLVLLVGLPLAFSLAVLAGSRVRVPASVDAALFRITVVILVAALVLASFRLGFSLVRWLLPYVEYAALPEPMHRRARIAVAGILFAVVTGVLANAVFALLR